MRSLIPLSLLLTILDSSVSVNAAKFPLDARYGPALRPRGSASTMLNITSLSNIQYVIDVKIGRASCRERVWMSV